MTDPMTSITLEIPASVAHKISETAPGTLAETALIALRLYHGLGLAARTTLEALAKRHDLTPAKTLRLAIEQLQKDSDRMQLGTGTAGRPIVNSERDADIYAKTRTGTTHATIAAEYGISLVRVGQIVARQRAMRKESLPARHKHTPILDAATLALDMDNGMPVVQVAAKYSLTAEEVSEKYRAYRANLPANPNMLDKLNAAKEVLTLKQQEESDTPDTPRKLAVIPPSMKNPELFPQPKPIKQVNPDAVDVSMFAEDNPDFSL